MHGQAARRTFYEPVRLDGAENKILISNTDSIYRSKICSGYSSNPFGGNRVSEQNRLNVSQISCLCLGLFSMKKNHKIFHKFCKNNFLYNIK